MNRILITSLWVVAFTGDCVADEPKRKKVLFIGIDGCRADAIDYSQAKHLKALIREGAFTDQTDVLGDRESGADTCTGPGWSTALTGVLADKHGVKDNTFRKHSLASYPTFLKRLKDARPNAEVAALVTWKEFHEHVFTASEGCQYLWDGEKKGYTEGDKLVAKTAISILSEKNPDALFVYFGEVDITGHGYGFHPKSPKYTNAIEAVDIHVGQIMKALADRTNFAKEDWLTIVCTDHGGQGRGHSAGQKITEIRRGFLILHGPSVKVGKIDAKTSNADVAVTALTHLGVKIDAAWKLDGKAVGERSKRD